jgi:type VI secretion system Hcp family effector
MKKSWLLLALSLSVFSFIHPTGFHSYASFKGSKQGQLKAASTKAKRGDKDRQADGWFELVSFDQGGESSTDGARTVAAGKRQHNTFTLTKGVDEATPELLQAHQTNEQFETVIIQTVNDQNQPSKTITLRSAVISAIKKTGDAESISFSYDSMEQQ